MKPFDKMIEESMPELSLSSNVAYRINNLAMINIRGGYFDASCIHIEQRTVSKILVELSRSKSAYFILAEEHDGENLVITAAMVKISDGIPTDFDLDDYLNTHGLYSYPYCYLLDGHLGACPLFELDGDWRNLAGEPCGIMSYCDTSFQYFNFCYCKIRKCSPDTWSY